MDPELRSLLWPSHRAHEALEALSRQAGFTSARTNHFVPPEMFLTTDDEAIGNFLQKASACLGLELEPVDCSYADLKSMLLRVGPALLPVKEGGTTAGFLALLPGKSGRLSTLSPELSVKAIEAVVVIYALTVDLTSESSTEIDHLLELASISPNRRSRARETLMRERLATTRIGPCYLLRIPPEASFTDRAHHSGLPLQLLGLLVAYAVQHGLWISSWLAIGRGVLEGRIDPGWLAAWVLLLLTLVPLRTLIIWWSGRLAIKGGVLIKERLLSSSLRLDPDKLRHQGVGQLMGKILESEAVETLALSGGFLALFSCLELVAAGVILSLGSGGFTHLLLLLLWIVITSILAWRYISERDQWTESRLSLTHNLIERMAGHQTRIAQQHPDKWHHGEDEELSVYHARSQSMDRIMALFSALVPRGWLMVGVAGLTPAFLSGGASMKGLAVAFGGVLLGYRAFRQIVEGLSYLLGAAISWKEVAPLFHADVPDEITQVPFPLEAWARERAEKGVAALEVRNLHYRYPERSEWVLRGLSMEIQKGERVLLQGPSGSGKSTLVSLLCGVRKPSSGLLLVSAIDHHLLHSTEWRKQVASAPQFHENHVFSGTLAMNLLMGRQWPPSEEDLKESEAVCRGLGLGDLIDRMPAGILQMVGETGWQLSQGERSRVFIARALLQQSEVVLFDESFGALDPETLRKVVHYVLESVPTLVAVAHL